MAAGDAVRIPRCARSCPLVRLLLRDLARLTGLTEDAVAVRWGLDPLDPEPDPRR